MLRMVMAAVILALAAGCVSKEQIAAQKAKIEERRTTARKVLKEIDVAEEKAAIHCSEKKSCDKAFSLAKVYVSDNADMKVQIADDTMVATYNPTKTGKIGMSAVKIPDSGDSAKIELTVTCNGLHAIEKSLGDPYFQVFQLCSGLILLHYEGFKNFVDSRMQ